MPLRSTDVHAVSGEIHAHLFENREAGVPRGLYWNLHLQCEPVMSGGEVWDCSFAVEWMALDVDRFDALAGVTLARMRDADAIEASLYIGEHHDVALDRLAFDAVDGGRVRVRAAGTVRIEGFDDLDVDACRFELDCDVAFDGVFVVPGNLFPKPGSLSEARDALSPYFDVATLDAGEFQRFKYVFPPAARAASERVRTPPDA